MPARELRRVRVALVLLILVSWTQAAFWSGQDAVSLLACCAIVGTAVLIRRAHLLLPALVLGWSVEAWFDSCGTFGWLRPLPVHIPCPLPTLSLFAWIGSVVFSAGVPTRWRAAAIPALALVSSLVLPLPYRRIPALAPPLRCESSSPAGWLAYSNNPESIDAGPRVLLRETVSGRGRLYASHYNLGLRPGQLSVAFANPRLSTVHVAVRNYRLVDDLSAFPRDTGSWLDLTPPHRAELTVAPGQRVAVRPALKDWLGNGILEAELDSDGPVNVTVESGDPPPDAPLAAPKGTQARGLLREPDRRLIATYEGGERSLSLTDGFPNGGYACSVNVELHALAPADVWVSARGGTLVVPIEGAPRVIPAGWAARLTRVSPGETFRWTFTLTANSYAPAALELSPGS